MEHDLSTCNLADLLNTFDIDDIAELAAEANMNFANRCLPNSEQFYQFEQTSVDPVPAPVEVPNNQSEGTTLLSEVAIEHQPTFLDFDASLNFDISLDLDTSQNEGDFFTNALWGLDDFKVPETYETYDFPAESSDSTQETLPETTPPSTVDAPADQEDNQRLDGEAKNSRSPSNKGHTSNHPVVDLARNDNREPQEPARKRRRHRRKQIVPADCSYTELVNAAPVNQRPSFPFPQQETIHSLPTTSTINTLSQTPLVPQVCGQTSNGYFIFVPTGNSPSSQMGPPPAPQMPSTTSGDMYTTSLSTLNVPAANRHITHLSPDPSRNYSTGSSRPSPTRQFTFAQNAVPDNFIANPNNHGRWIIDESGKRHYLNGPKTKRPRS